jgi:hypothetical protein
VTIGRPGRRFVEVVQLFGDHGYVYSICREDWGPAMRDIARMIARGVHG